MFLNPFADGGIVLGPILHVELRDLGYQRVIRIGIGQQGGNRQEDFGDRQCRAPPQTPSWFWLPAKAKAFKLA